MDVVICYYGKLLARHIFFWFICIIAIAADDIFTRYGVDSESGPTVRGYIFKLTRYESCGTIIRDVVEKCCHFFTRHRLIRSECAVGIAFHQICFSYSTNGVSSPKIARHICKDVGTDFLNILWCTNRSIYNYR